MANYELKASFVRGELTPLAHARNDVQMFAHGAAELQNFLVMREGGVTRRSGTRYRGQTKFADKFTRLVGFSFDENQSYIFEMGDHYTRFWANGGQIVSSGSPVEIVSPYAEADLPSLQWVSSGNVTYFAFKSMTVKPKKLVRTSHTSWSYSDVEFRDGPYLPINDQENKLNVSVLSTPISIGDAATFVFANTKNINSGAGFVSTDVGRQIRVELSGVWLWATITAVTDDHTVDVEWQSTIPVGTIVSDPTTKTWRLGAFCDTTGYPGSVAIFQGRLFWASLPTDPNLTAYSRSNLPTTFSPSDPDGTVAEDHGGCFTLLSGETVLWMQEATRLQIGTPSNIRSLGASDTAQSFGPRSISQRVEVSDGVNSARPAVIGPSTVHASRFGTHINDLFYDFQANSLIAPELSTTSDHMLKTGVVELTFQKLPHRILWAVLGNGKLVATTIDRYEKVAGFSRHEIGGTVKSAQSIPGVSGFDTYLVVRRTINGSNVQYIETIDPRFDADLVSQADAFFVDCGATYSGAPTNTISGLTWLANCEVDILADGAVMPRATVTADGHLTIPRGKLASKVQVGLPIDAHGKTLPLPNAVVDGTGMGRRVRVVSVIANVYQTGSLQFRSDTGVVDELHYRHGNEPMGQPPALRTGFKEIFSDGSWQSHGQVEFVCSQPLPATIRALTIQMETEP